MRLAALLSGGKDSTYSAYLMKKEGHEIKYIVSLVSENPESYMFHVPNVHLVKDIAQLMGISFIQKLTKGEKEKELEDIKAALSGIKGEIDGIVTGAVASKYQKFRIDRICDELGLKSLAPLWQRDPETVAKEMVKAGFEVIITSVSAPPMDRSWLGRRYDEYCIRDLVKLNKSYGIHILGEGGEFESLVLNCPMFSKKIIVAESEKVWDDKTHSGFLKIIRINLAGK